MISAARQEAFEPETGHLSVETYGAWALTLAQASSSIKDLAGSTENGFLAIGSKLNDFYMRAGEIMQRSEDVVNLVSGEEICDAIKRLHDILETMGRYLVTADQEAEQGSATFSNILGQLDKVADPLAGFKKINKSLSMLGISTKIESARLGQSAAGFDTLANDVSKLSVQVIEKSDTIMGKKEELSGVIQQTLLKVVSTAVEQRRNVRDVLDKTNGSLSILRDINSRCSSAASVISGVSADVAASIGEVVTSLQFHDISRQQIEHVHETLDELGVRLQNAGDSDVELVNDLGDLCELQAAQLEHARDELLAAVQTVISNLMAVANQEGLLSDQTRNIAGVADKAGSSFFTDMEKDLSLVTEVLTQSAAENRKQADAMNLVAKTVGNIATFVSDIENIGEEIELIAINAQIKAARTGNDGAALGVLAEAIQRLSQDTRLHTNVVSETLRSITDFIEGLCKGVDEDASNIETEIREMVGELKGLLQTLRSVNENLIKQLVLMDHEVQDLSEEIQSAIGGIAVHDMVARKVAETVLVLNTVIAEARAIVPAESIIGRTERLKEIAGRYTMHSERKIHQTFAGAGAPAAELCGNAPSSAGDLGDNVELF